MDFVGRGVIVEYRYQGGGEIADHDTDNKQHDVAFHLGREPDDQSQYAGCPGKGGEDNSEIAADRQLGDHAQRTAEIEHDGSHSQVGSVADSQDGRACQRVTEQGLQQQSAGCQRSTGQQSRNGLREAALQDDILPGGTTDVFPHQNIDNALQRNGYGTVYQPTQK